MLAALVPHLPLLWYILFFALTITLVTVFATTPRPAAPAVTPGLVVTLVVGALAFSLLAGLTLTASQHLHAELIANCVALTDRTSVSMGESARQALCACLFDSVHAPGAARACYRQGESPGTDL